MDINGMLQQLRGELADIQEVVAVLERIAAGKRKGQHSDWLRELQEQGELTPIRFQDL
jgi:hypothetical protein